jgi:hypothetical protein
VMATLCFLAMNALAPDRQGLVGAFGLARAQSGT